MKKILVLLAALTVHAIHSFGGEVLLPEGVSVTTDTTIVKDLYVGVEDGLAGGVIVDSSSTSKDATIDSMYFVVNVSQEMIPETLSNMYNWSVRDGSTVLKFTTNATFSSYTFELNLTEGSVGLDVFKLQRILNSNTNTCIARSGRSSPGRETMYFDAAMKIAVAKYQMLHGLPSTGFVGPLTRAVLSSEIPSFAIVSFNDLGYKVVPKTVKRLSVTCEVDGAIDPYLTVSVIDSSAAPVTPYPIQINGFYIEKINSLTNRLVLVGNIEPYTSYNIQASTNLFDWENVGNVLPSDSTDMKAVGYIDNSRYSERGFFRLMRP